MFDALAHKSERLHARRAMSSEERLLLLLARGRLNDAIRAQASSLLQQSQSWPTLLQMAQFYCVTPLFYENLRQLGFLNVPAVVVADLSAAYRLNAMRNTLMGRELAEVLQRLGAAGVPVMPLKGVALAASLYGNPSLRVCGDIDILVPLPRVRQAHDLLQAMGYCGELAGWPERSFPPHGLKTNIEYALIRQERGFRYLLDLHWGIFLGGTLEREALDTLWAEARAMPVFGVMAFLPSAEWSIMFLAVHAARHQWRGLKWLCDIHELCTSTTIDWAKVRLHAEQFGWENLVELTLSACHTLFDTPIPPHISARTLPPWVQLFPNDLLPTAAWRDVLARAHLLKSPLARWRYLMRVLLIPTLAEHRLIRLPAAFSMLYYPLRPARLGVKYARSLGAACLRPIKEAPSRRY